MMKKHSLIFAFSVYVISAHAQYVFNSCGSRPAFGDSLTGGFALYDTTAIGPGASGANVTWDYRNIILSNSGVISHMYYDPSLTEGFSMFPKANVADLGPNGVYTYLANSPDSSVFLGDYHDMYDYHFAWDPQKQGKCPLNFGDTFTDYFARYGFGQCPYHHTYTKRVATYDAYGTLWVSKVGLQVARLKIIDNMLDTAVCVGPPIISHTVDTFYIWYDITTNQQVFLLHTFIDTGNHYINKFVERDNYYHLPLMVSTTGVSEIEQEAGISLYPNPSNGKFIMQGANGQFLKANNQLEIYNVMGEKIYLPAGQAGSISNLNIQAFNEIDISSQPDGIYFLQIKTEQGVINKKIIISK